MYMFLRNTYCTVNITNHRFSQHGHRMLDHTLDTWYEIDRVVVLVFESYP